MQFKRGDKVKLTKSWAEWLLEEGHECYIKPKTGEIPADSGYDQDMQLAMLVILGAPPVGTVLGKPMDYKVSFGKYGVSHYTEEELYPATSSELELDLPVDLYRFLTKVAKATLLKPEQVAAVLITAGVMRDANLD